MKEEEDTRDRPGDSGEHGPFTNLREYETREKDETVATWRHGSRVRGSARLCV